jgi:hypothetical protein
MDVAILTLRPGSGTRSPDVNGEILTDILWTHAAAEDRIEHMRVTIAPDVGEYVLGVFMLSVQRLDCDSHRTAIEVCRKAIASSPLLRGWTVESREM